MELVKSGAIEMLSRRSVAIKDYSVENGENDEEEEEEDEEEKQQQQHHHHHDESDRTSLKIDLSMAEQFYYEVISSFEQEEVLHTLQIVRHYLIHLQLVEHRMHVR